MEEQTRTRLILACGVLGVTSSAFIIRTADQPSYALAGTRVFLTGIISFFLLNRDYNLSLSRKDIGKIVLSGISLASHFGWWFDSLNHLPIGTSLSLTNTAPVWMAVILLLFFQTSIKRRQLISILCVILGSTILFIDNSGTQSGDIIGLSLALGSAVGFAIYLILAREMVPKLGLWKYFGLVNLVAAMVLFPWAAGLGQFNVVTPRRLWFYGLLLALIPGISGHAIYNWTIPKLDTIDVGVATLGEPILGTIIAWFGLSEILSPLQVLGIIFLILAIAFTLEPNSRDETANEEKLAT